MIEVNYETHIIYFNHHGVASFMILTIVFLGVRCLTRTLPKGSTTTDAKAGWCSVLQLLRLEVRYHRYSGFSGGVDHTPATQAGFDTESSN